MTNPNLTEFSIQSIQLGLIGIENLVGKSFIIHADEDDFISQPSGNAGARIACGVIRTEEHVTIS